MGLKKIWKNRTKLEKVCICSVVFLFVVVVILFVSFLSSQVNGVCNSPQCVRGAVHLLEMVDPNVDPCDDFYKFACGTFLQNAFVFGLPNSLHSLSKLAKNQVKAIIMENMDESALPKALVRQRQFYRNCLNVTNIEEDNNNSVKEVLDEVLGGWPILDSYNWPEKKYDWSKATVKARRTGVYYQFFFKINLFPAMIDNKRVLWIKPPRFNEVASFEWKERNIEYIAEIASYLGAQSAVVTTELRRTMYFAQQLDEVINKHFNKSMDDSEDFTVNNITIGDMEHIHFQLDWLTFLKDITGLPLKQDDVIVSEVDDYLKDLYYLLLKTPKKIQADYMGWAIISNNINYLTEKVRNKYMELRKVVSEHSSEEQNSRKELCYTLAKGLFSHVAEAEYVRRYTTLEKKKYIREMIANIKGELKTSLQATPWMDKITRERALKHLDNITEAIGWTDIAFDVKMFDETFGYDKVKFSSDNFLHMARAVSLVETDNYFQQITKNVTRFDYLVQSPRLDVNAYFLQYMNILILPAPILQGQLFDEEKPRYMNYGSLGSIIGHELTHGFDGNMGMDIDDERNEGPYWTNMTIENFENVTKCLRDEYDKYDEMLSGFSKNGSNFEENLADYNAIHIAYRAYQNWVADNGQEESLPGIKYTPNQIFWLMASTYMCYEPSLSEKDTSKKSAIHGVPSFRVVGRLRNSEDFARDFNCPEGSRMNPKDKCRIYP